MADKKCKKIGDRIFYVEPNDASGVVANVNGKDVPLTPDYSDMCMSLRILVENVDRGESKNYATIDKNGVKTFVSNAGSNFFGQNTEPDEQGFNRYHTFYAKGAQFVDNEREYLSTYYTDITPMDFGGNEKFEGLGITSVSISYESFYTPTVKIHFVDVRGCSLIGREEYIHDNDGELLGSNLFGSFFTMPYPKFMVQVKGFYGRAVTYQLSCLDFQATLNSQTGNFEADVTFIGYEYGILSDLPMRYIMAAPYCNYVGRDYWNSNVNSERWKLGKDGSESPITLSELAKLIRKSMQENISAVATPEEANRLEALNSYRVKIGEAEERYNSAAEMVETVYPIAFRTFEEDVPGQDESRKKFANPFVQSLGYGFYRQGVIPYVGAQDISATCYECQRMVLGNSVVMYGAYVTRDVLERLRESSSRYASTVTFYCGEKVYNISNFWLWDGTGVDFGRDDSWNDLLVSFDIDNNNLGVKYRLKDINIKDSDAIREIVDTYSDVITSTKVTEETFLSVIHDEMSATDAEIQRINNAISNRETEEKIDPVSVFKVTPYIGHLFKLTLCHLETFMKIMFSCVEQIKNNPNERKTKKIDGNNGNETMMPPFFDVFMEKNDENGEDGSVQVIGWPGNLETSSMFEEVRLVNELCLAAKRENMENENSVPTINYNSGYYILPCDVAMEGNLPGISTSRNKDKTACWLSNRAASLFGVCFTNATETEADAIGRIDACRFFFQNGNFADMILTVGDEMTEYDFVDVMMNVSTCSTDRRYEKYSSGNNVDGKTMYSFEIASNLKGVRDESRNPVFEENGDNLEYRYICNKYGDGYVLQDLPEEYQRNTIGHIVTAAKDNDGKLFYNLNHNEDLPEYLYGAGTDVVFLHDDALQPSDIEKYSNRFVFDIERNGSFFDLYDKMVNSETLSFGTRKVDNPRCVRDVFRKYWKCGEDDIKPYYAHGDGKRTFMLYDEKVYDGTSSVDEKGNFLETTDFEGKNWYSKSEDMSFDGIGWKLVQNQGDKNVKPCVLEMQVSGKFANGETKNMSLFSSHHYYLQKDEYSKAYVFVMSIPCNMTNNVFDSETEGYVKVVPYVYALKLGAMLWRKEKDSDPIMFEDGFKKGSCGKDSSMLVSDGNSCQYVAYSQWNDFKTIPFNDIIAADIDIVVKNKLVSLFESFVKDEFGSIRDGLEILSTTGGAEGEMTIEQLRAVENNVKNSWISNKKHALSDIYAATDLLKKYDNICVDEDSGKILRLRIRKDNKAIERIIDIYTRNVVVLKSSGAKHGKTGDISVKKEIFRSYLNGFCSFLKEIKNSRIEDSVVSDGDETDEANKLNVYLLLKNLYDRWLRSKTSEPDGFNQFRVENFMEHFVFIDTFYRNIANRLHINVDTLLPSISGNSRDAMLLKFFQDIASIHNCMFFGMPDYTSFHIQERQGGMTPVDWMNDMFTPIPYGKIEDVETSNKFVIMYTHSPSRICRDGNGYKRDCFDIINEDSLPSVLKQSDGRLYDTTGRNVQKVSSIHDRKYFDIPAFGVVFGRQNNSVFKSISVGMSNPTITAQSLQALANIAERGQEGTRVRYSYGQDLYNVYSGYSYTCEVEMMGCAQILPLMYFQLTNVPLFNGTYMIFGVEHQMTPGNMTTRFKGIKICRYAFPFTHDWFSKDNPWGSTVYSEKDSQFDECEADVSVEKYNGCEDIHK